MELTSVPLPSNRPWNRSRKDDAAVYRVLYDQEMARRMYARTTIVLWMNRWMGYPDHHEVYGVDWIEAHCHDSEKNDPQD